jgi:hypothetical protein
MLRADALVHGVPGVNAERRTRSGPSAVERKTGRARRLGDGLHSENLDDTDGLCLLCRVSRHRKLLGFGAIGPYAGDIHSTVIPRASGSLCPRGTVAHVHRPKTVPPCTPDSCPPPPSTIIPGRCCVLDVTDFSVPFDIEHPPSHFAGSYTCADESGQFDLIEGQ